MQTTISILKRNVSAAIEELTEFARISFCLKTNDVFTEITVIYGKETDIARVREIEKKYNHE